ncbi:17690_t:CDS:2, partial [Gigaspora rosea]
ILMKNHANIKHKNKDGETVLHKAAAAGHLEITKDLFNQMNQKDFIDEKILDLAAENKHKEIVKYLLEEEAGIETANNDLILHDAKKEDIEAVKVLLENGAQFNSIIDKNNRTPLHWAASEGCEVDIRYLVRKNENLIKANDDNNETAIYESVWNGHLEITKILLEEDSDLINSKNKYGYTPLHIAAMSCQVETFNFLKSKANLQLDLEEFFDKLDDYQLKNYSKFNIYYNNIQGLIKKLKTLENQFAKLSNIDFTPFYQYFLKRIENYAEHVDIKEKREENKKVL